jgi:hypothetical protein
MDLFQHIHASVFGFFETERLIWRNVTGRLLLPDLAMISGLLL